MNAPSQVSRIEILSALPFRPDDDEVFEWLELSDFLIALTSKSETNVDGLKVDEIAKELNLAVQAGLVEKEADGSIFGTRFRLTWDGERARDDLSSAQPNGLFDPQIFDPAIFDTGLQIDSRSWTGRFLTESQKMQLVKDIDGALGKVDDLGLDQAKKSQVRALLLAARMLSEAPEPPLDIIKLLFGNVDRIIGVAGFFVGIAGLLMGAA